MSVTRSRGAAMIISSTYLLYNGMSNFKVFKAWVSRSCITMSAMIGDNGDPIGVPCVCLKIVLLKEKNVDDNTNFTANRNSSSGIFVFFSI